MRIASWNINSVRLRLGLVLKVLEELELDVLCLQETKTQDEFFPEDEIKQAGWPHICFRGEKSYNGVAIISRLPIDDVQMAICAPLGKGGGRHCTGGDRAHQNRFHLHFTILFGPVVCPVLVKLPVAFAKTPPSLPHIFAAKPRIDMGADGWPWQRSTPDMGI